MAAVVAAVVVLAFMSLFLANQGTPVAESAPAGSNATDRSENNQTHLPVPKTPSTDAEPANAREDTSPTEDKSSEARTADSQQRSEDRGPHTTDRTPQEIIAEAERSVVTVQVDTSQGQGSGSGFFVDSSGTLVTNFHVVEGATQVTVLLNTGQQYVSDGWFAVSPEKDLAVLRVRLPFPATPLTLQPELPQKADSVYALGSSLGLEGTVSEGIVSSIRSNGDLTLIQTTAAISHGNSGGPLLNPQGQVVAVISFTLSEGQNLNFAVSSQHVEELLATKNRVPLNWAQLPPSQSRQRTRTREADRKSAGDVDEAANKVAESIKKAQESAAEQQAKQAKLARINQAISDLEHRIAAIEVEGTALTETRGQIMSEATGLVTEGQRLEQQCAVLRNSLQGIQTEMSITIPNEEGGYQRIQVRQQQYRTLENEIAAVQLRYAAIEARLVSIDRQARDLLAQIEYKSDQRDELEDERQLLIVQGEIVSLGESKFIDSLFAQWDMNGDGMLSPAEVPDKYDALMNKANTDNNGFVTRYELQTVVSTLGSTP